MLSGGEGTYEVFLYCKVHVIIVSYTQLESWHLHPVKNAPDGSYGNSQDLWNTQLPLPEPPKHTKRLTTQKNL